MIEFDPDNALKARTASRPIVVFTRLAAALLVLVGSTAYLAYGTAAVAVVVFCAIGLLCLRGLIHSYPHEVFGACNGVTLVRTALVALLAEAIVSPPTPWFVFSVALIAFASDGLDGWLARRAGLSSVFGARFDMEADALLGAVLALILLTHGTLGPAILVLGFSRYVFVVAGWIWPALQGQLPESYRRKTICVVQIAALIALLCPLTPAPHLPWIASGAAALLLYSFAIDIWALLHGHSERRVL